MRQMLVRDPNPGVAHDYFRVAARIANVHAKFATWDVVVDGIAHDIGDRIQQLIAIAQARNRRRLDHDVEPPRLRQRTNILERGFGDLVQTHGQPSNVGRSQL
jgi:hypothetical protein